MNNICEVWRRLINFEWGIKFIVDNYYTSISDPIANRISSLIYHDDILDSLTAKYSVLIYVISTIEMN